MSALATQLRQIGTAHVAAAIASTNQGHTIRDNSKKIGWQINEPFTILEGSESVLTGPIQINLPVH